MWVVKRCVKDYEDVFKWDFSEHETEAEADAAADAANESRDSGVWFEVHEE